MQLFRAKRVIVLLILIISVGCKENKSEVKSKQAQKWYRGNLHTHSYWSDGDEFPEVILDWYKSKGYHFMALSDHNTLAEGEKWITVREDSLYQNAFQDYLQNYGSDWVEHKIDSGNTVVKLKTFEEYSNKVEEAGTFLVIQSEEITDKFEEKHIHMNATNVQKKIEPMGGTSVLKVMQNNLDQVIEQRKETGIPMIPHINHPNFHYSIGLDDMISLKGERFFEVYNGHPMVHNMGDSTHISTEEMWDLINISYIENKKPLMYGLATDDSHHYHKKGKKWSNAGRGWIEVRADTLSAAALIAAMEAGNFYATTGVKLKKLTFNNNELSVEVEPEADTTYTIVFIGCEKGESETGVLKSFVGNEATFELTNDLLFVRCKITSTKLQDNPIEHSLYEMAFTQPVMRNE